MNALIKRLRSDILIPGPGGAGLFAALRAHRAAPQLPAAILPAAIAVKGPLANYGCARRVRGGGNPARLTQREAA